MQASLGYENSIIPTLNLQRAHILSSLELDK